MQKLLSQLGVVGMSGREMGKMTHVVSGDIVEIRIRLIVSPTKQETLDYDPDSLERREIDHFRYMYSELLGNCRKLTKETLGEKFDISEMKIRRGSVEILITICAIGFVVFEGFSKYKNFCDSLDLLKRQMGTMFQQVRTTDFNRDVAPSSISTMLPGMNMSVHDVLSFEREYAIPSGSVNVLKKIFYCILVLTLVLVLRVAWDFLRYYHLV